MKDEDAKLVINLCKGERLWVAMSPQFPGQLFKGRSPAEAYGKLIAFNVGTIRILPSVWGHKGSRGIIGVSPLHHDEGRFFLEELAHCESLPRRKPHNLVASMN